MNDSQFTTWESAVLWLMSQPEQQELVKACYYDAPLEKAADRYWQSAEWVAIKAFCPAPMGKVLDIGAGNGITSYALAREGWNVEALEPDPSDLVGGGAIRRLAQASHLTINVVQGFGEQLPFPDSHFEMVLARQVLHHAQDLPQLCQQIYRVLKPGGVFIAVRDHVISSHGDLEQFLNSHPLHKLYDGENAFLLKDYTQAIQSSGLKLDQVIKPFGSVINYSPLTQFELKQEFFKRFRRIPCGTLVASLLLSDSLFKLFLNLVSIFDHRPGRPYSFVAHKSKES
jgi:ubiquinone/menaquinone biosynthesis C-methylase UbiE